MLELAIYSQVPRRHLAGCGVAKNTASMGHQIVQRGGNAVSGQVGRGGAHDHLDRTQLPADHALARLSADPETDIHTVRHPVANAIVKPDVGLNVGVSPAERIEQLHENRRE